MKKVILYTDGACSGNPGLGGWGCILMYKGKERILSGGEKMTTNNKMELTAVIKGLEALKEKCDVEIYSDSAYVVNAFNEGWISNWLMKGWKSSKGQVSNIELWQRLVDLSCEHKLTFNKVKGHSDNEYNNKCDALARGEIEKLKKDSE